MLAFKQQEMDISSFCAENFETKEWINNILKSGDADKKENSTMALVMKLQLYVQQVNNALEETSNQVLVSLPKIIRDTKSLEEEAMLLKDKMTIVRKDIAQIEQDTGGSINNIEKLDRMKSRLLDAKQGLHESDNWTVLVNDLEEIFDSKNVKIISKKILSMQQSLKLLVNVADYEERKIQLEGLKNRLEAIASPSIVQIFSSHNVEQAKEYTEIFRSIGRLNQLLKYYHKCQKDILLKKWRSQLDEQDDSAVQLIHNYHNILLSNWHTQYKWLKEVFNETLASETFLDIYIDVLINLDPTVNECIDAALKQTTEKLNILQEVKHTIKQFASSLLGIFNKVEVKSEQRVQLLQVIFSPMVPYVSKYAAYEQAFLCQKLSQINCIKEELTDTIQSLGFSITTVIDLARESQKRCKEITENCGYCGLLIALRAFLISYADQYRVALRQIDRSKGKKEDWATFQLCLSLLQNAGDVLDNLQKFEKELTAPLLEPNTFESIIDNKLLMLNNNDMKEYESLIKCVTDGTKLSLLDHVIMDFTKLSSDIHHTTYQVVFSPISVHLDLVQNTKTWTQSSEAAIHQNDLPDYSFSPQEYITQIGQYLMTLPQHLEPFLFRDNPSLNCALKAADEEYSNSEEAEGAMADVFLKIVARGTCQAYAERILNICELNNHSSRQLAHDIGYLENVLLDLGLPLSENLQQLMILLKLPADQYQAQSSGYSARYVATVRQMRNITSSC